MNYKSFKILFDIVQIHCTEVKFEMLLHATFNEIWNENIWMCSIT